MAGIAATDARQWVDVYERLLEPHNVLVMGRSMLDRELLQRHRERLQERLAFWKRDA